MISAVSMEWFLNDPVLGIRRIWWVNGYSPPDTPLTPAGRDVPAVDCTIGAPVFAAVGNYTDGMLPHPYRMFRSGGITWVTRTGWELETVLPALVDVLRVRQPTAEELRRAFGLVEGIGYPGTAHLDGISTHNKTTG